MQKSLDDANAMLESSEYRPGAAGNLYKAINVLVPICRSADRQARIEDFRVLVKVLVCSGSRGGEKVERAEIKVTRKDAFPRLPE